MHNIEPKTETAQTSVVEPESRRLRDIFLGRKRVKATLLMSNGQNIPVEVRQWARGTKTIKVDFDQIFEQAEEAAEIPEATDEVPETQTREEQETPTAGDVAEEDSGEANLQADQDAEMREGTNRSQLEVTE